MYGFFNTVPRELDEAAKIDGATHAQIFWTIILRLVAPILAVVGLLSFIGTFGEFLIAKVVLQRPEEYTLAVGLYSWASDERNAQLGPVRGRCRARRHPGGRALPRPAEVHRRRADGGVGQGMSRVRHLLDRRTTTARSSTSGVPRRGSATSSRCASGCPRRVPSGPSGCARSATRSRAWCEARLERADEHARWYVADVPVHNPVASYRVLLDEPGGYRWLNGRGRARSGTSRTRATSGSPCTTRRRPGWTRPWSTRCSRTGSRGRARQTGDLCRTGRCRPRGTTSRSAADPASRQQLFGGDLPGVEQRLDHLQRLGVDTLYLTPVFPGRSNHRYDASTFDHVDPLLGGDEALASLSRAVHARGMRILGDLTTNHTGAGHEWFARAQADRSSEEASFYYWTDDDPGYVGWLEHASLPKLNYNAPALAGRMVEGPDSVIGRWLVEPYSLDGWRIDVANMTGRYADDDLTLQVARTIRSTMHALNPEAVLVSEHFHDAGTDLAAGGWHANMNYSAFTRPVWTWLVDPAAGPRLPRDAGADPAPRRGVDGRRRCATSTRPCRGP